MAKGNGPVITLAIIVFLLSLNAVYALFEMVIKGPQYNMNMLALLGGSFEISIVLYSLLSITLTVLSLGILSSLFIKRVTTDPEADTLEKLDAKLVNNREELERVVTETFAKLSMNEFKITEDLKNVEKQIIENQKRIDNLGEIRDKYAKTMEKQIFTLRDIKKKIGEVESQLTPKPHLVGNSDVQTVSGVGQKIAEELRAAGISDVDTLVTEDPTVLAGRTGLSRNKIEKIQGAAQLLTIPGIDEERMRLLQKAGITSADSLAAQNPIQLYKKVADAAENQQKPTLGELASYVRFARSNSSIL